MYLSFEVKKQYFTKNLAKIKGLLIISIDFLQLVMRKPFYFLLKSCYQKYWIPTIKIKYLIFVLGVDIRLKL